MIIFLAIENVHGKCSIKKCTLLAKCKDNQKAMCLNNKCVCKLTGLSEKKAKTKCKLWNCQRHCRKTSDNQETGECLEGNCVCFIPNQEN